MDRRRRDKIIQVAKKLDAAQVRLQALEAELDELLNGFRLEQQQERVPNVSDWIVRHVQENPRESFTASELSDVLGSTSAVTVRSLLARLCQEERIERRGRGLYGCVTLLASDPTVRFDEDEDLERSA